jgi:hypothetical protein
MFHFHAQQHNRRYFIILLQMGIDNQIIVKANLIYNRFLCLFGQFVVMPFFGLGSKNKKKEKAPIKEKPEIAYYAKYMGGLNKVPKEGHSMVLIFPDRIEVTPFGLTSSK